jgi:hypothetical protein
MTATHVLAADLTEVAWTKSGRSASVAGCVEVGVYGGGIVLRNSNDPGAGGLLFTDAEFEAFVGGAKDGDFDGITRLT